MKYIHILWSKLHFCLVKDVEVFHAYVVFLVEETLFLYSCHVEDVKARHSVFETDNFFIFDVVAVQYIMTDIFRKP